MKIGLTHWILRIPKEEYEGMLKKLDELFFRVISVLIAFMALRGPVEIPASKILQVIEFTEEFYGSAYPAFAHILFSLLGAVTAPYFPEFRYFEEGAITSGIIMCIWLVFDLYSQDTVKKLGVFAFWFFVALVILLVLVLILKKIWNKICGWAVSSWNKICGWVVSLWISLRTIPTFFTGLGSSLGDCIRNIWADILDLFKEKWMEIVIVIVLLILVGFVYFIVLHEFRIF